jgi:hypothetical protein
MAHVAKPPVAPAFPTGSTLTYPPALQQMSNAAYTAMVTRAPDATQKDEQFMTALRAQQNLGVASGIYKPSKVKPLFGTGGKTRRRRTGAGLVGTTLETLKARFPSKGSQHQSTDPRQQGEDLAAEMKKYREAFLPVAAEAKEALSAFRRGATRRTKSSGGDIVCHLLTIRNQIKLYHWQTKQFARHKATDDLTAALDLNIDAFVESYMGRYGRPHVTGGIKLHNFSEAAAKAFVAKETKYLETELPRKIGKNDTDLLNLRDTILGDLTKVSYLFTLN